MTTLLIKILRLFDQNLMLKSCQGHQPFSTGSNFNVTPAELLYLMTNMKLMLFVLFSVYVDFNWCNAHGQCHRLDQNKDLYVCCCEPGMTIYSLLYFPSYMIFVQVHFHIGYEYRFNQQINWPRLLIEQHYIIDN